MISTLSIIKYIHVSNCSTTKKVWDALEMIYEGSTEAKREMMNTLDQELETPNDYKENPEKLILYC